MEIPVLGCRGLATFISLYVGVVCTTYIPTRVGIDWFCPLSHKMFVIPYIYLVNSTASIYFPAPNSGSGTAVTAIAERVPYTLSCTSCAMDERACLHCSKSSTWKYRGRWCWRHVVMAACAHTAVCIEIHQYGVVMR